MKYYFHYLFLVFFLLSSYQARSLESQISAQKFEQVFTTAGYSTALGAAMGTAILGLSKNPRKHLNYIVLGASVGFISGSLLGGYFAFAPKFQDLNTQSSPKNSRTFSELFSLTPVFDFKNFDKTSLLAKLEFEF